MLDREGVYRRGSGMLRITESERTLRVSAQTFFMLLVVTAFSAHLLSRWVLAIGIFFRYQLRLSSRNNYCFQSCDTFTHGTRGEESNSLWLRIHREAGIFGASSFKEAGNQPPRFRGR